MPTYTPWTTLAGLISDYNAGAGHPQGSDSAADLDDAIRQLQGFLVNFLSVTFDPTTNLPKSSAFSADTFSMEVIPGSAIQGNINGSKLTAGTVTSAQLKVVDSDGTDGAVAASNITWGAVGSDQLATASVIAGKIAAGAINGASLFASKIVPTAAIADDAITDDKLADNLSGTHLASGTIAATALAIADLGGSGFGIPYVNGVAASSNKIAKIGGAVTASYNAGTNTIELAIAASSSANVYRFELAASGDSVITTAAKRIGWSKTDGGTNISISNAGVAAERFDIVNPGTYLVMFELLGYSTESFQSILYVNGAPLAGGYGTSPFLPLGAGGQSVGKAVVTLTAAGYINIYHLAGRVQAANGLGYSTLPNAKYGQLTIIQLA